MNESVLSDFWDVRAGDLVCVTKTRGRDIVTITAQAGQLVSTGEPDSTYWTHKLGGVLCYEQEEFVTQHIEILERFKFSEQV